MTNLGVGIVGCGNISTTYLRLAPLFRGIEVRACADVNMEVAKARGAEYGVRAETVDALLANVCKQNVTRLPYEIVRLAEDLAGGLMATMPSLADLDHATLGPLLQRAIGSSSRARLLRLVEWFAYGSGSVPLRIECMHGAGSPAAQRLVIDRSVDWDERVRMAKRLAGVE